MAALFQRCDAFFFTGLRDTFGSVVLEALSNGLPVVTVNHQGVGAFVPEDASIKVPVSSLDDTVKDLALAFKRSRRSLITARKCPGELCDLQSNRPGGGGPS